MDPVVTPEPWQRVKALFQSAVERPPEERDVFLRAATGDDADLRREVESLLTSDVSDTAFLPHLPLSNELGLQLTASLAAAGSSMEQASSRALIPGVRVGPFEIVAPLGAGTMGEVYRACDTKLNRDVALKVLPELFALDPARLARFKREAQLLATLNHQNIGAIYGLEESNGTQALVLELVDGPTLADRIDDGPIPLAEALIIARQIAEALDAAHAKGIIHRDLKPANIKIASTGVVKVLDFGLAKVWNGAPQSEVPESLSSASDPSRQAPTDTSEQIVLGTPAYMSPEQTRCESLDSRTDIWSFGCVFYEMLAGRAPFSGDTISETLTAILERGPNWALLPTDVPLSVRTLLLRCLEKDRNARLDSAASARLGIADALAALDAETRVRPSATFRHATMVAMVTSIGIALATAILAWLVMRPTPPAPIQSSRFAIVTPPAQPLNVYSRDRDLALSPDGRHLVYRAGGSETAGSPLMVRAIGQIDARLLAGITWAYAPFFSPDSRWIGFFENGELKKVSIDGGRVITLCPVVGGALGASWGDDNTIVFATDDPTTGLLRVSADGGKAVVLTMPNAARHETDHQFPSMLPGAGRVLFTVAARGQTDSAGVAVIDLSTGQRKMLVRGTQGEYVNPSTGSGSSGQLIYAAAGTLQTVRFDPIRLDVLSEPATVIERVMMKPSGAANYATSRTGALAYTPGGESQREPPRSLVWVDRNGHEEALKTPRRTYGPPRISPDGTRLALGILEQGNTEIWIWDLAKETLRRLTVASGMNGMPLWTRDGERVIFMSDRTGVLNLYSQAADGTGIADRLTASAFPQWPTSITADGTHLFGFDLGPKKLSGVIVVHMTTRANRLPLNDAQATPNTASTARLVQTLFNGAFAEISPDGRYIAYQSGESGRLEVYVRPFAQGASGRWQISTGGATRPAWARSGRELFYLDESNTLIAVPVRTSGPTFIAGNPTTVFDTKYVEPNPARHYDVSPDGQRFLMLKDSGGNPNETPASMVVVLNWFDDLQRRVPTTPIPLATAQ